MNPEFQRNLYLEFSTARLVGMPAFLSVVFSLTFLIDGKAFEQATANTALGLYIALVLFWGARQAAESIFEELRSNTWDIQKTSAISPWSLTWGKLLGSTIFNWYGGLLCLLVYSMATPEPEYIRLTWVYFLSGGLLAQSLSLLVSLFSFGSRRQNINGGIGYIFALFILFSIVPMMFNVDKFDNDVLYWYGKGYDQTYFYASSLVIACVWAVIGIYRLLSEELRIRTLPWVWIVFIAFLIVYLSGIFVSLDMTLQQNIGTSVLLVSFVICVISSYLLLFINENSPMMLRKLWVYYQQRQWLKMAQEIPCWIVSVDLAFPVMLMLMLLYPIKGLGEINFYPVVIYLLMLRDIAMLLYFSYAPNPKRAMSLTLLYMVCLYALLPAIFNSMGADAIAGIIFPVLNNNLLLAILFAGIQTSIIAFLLFQRWQSRVADVENL